MKQNQSQKLLATLLASSLFFLGACSTQTTSPTTTPSQSSNTTSDSGVDTDGDGLSDTVEKTYGTNPYLADTDGDGIDDKQDAQPLWSDVTISETSQTVLPISVNDVKVEDNTSSDHLEMTLTNTSSKDLSNFDIYYTITDKKTGDKESYIQNLSGLVISANSTVTLHFDNNVTTPNHFYQNMNGLYGTSANGLTFDIQLHSLGYAPLDFSVDKADGTAEVSD